MLEELRQLESNLYENKLRTIDYMETASKRDNVETVDSYWLYSFLIDNLK